MRVRRQSNPISETRLQSLMKHHVVVCDVQIRRVNLSIYSHALPQTGNVRTQASLNSYSQKT